MSRRRRARVADEPGQARRERPGSPLRPFHSQGDRRAAAAGVRAAERPGVAAAGRDDGGEPGGIVRARRSAGSPSASRGRAARVAATRRSAGRPARAAPPTSRARRYRGQARPRRSLPRRPPLRSAPPPPPPGSCFAHAGADCCACCACLRSAPAVTAADAQGQGMARAGSGKETAAVDAGRVRLVLQSCCGRLGPEVTCESDCRFLISPARRPRRARRRPGHGGPDGRRRGL